MSENNIRINIGRILLGILLITIGIGIGIGITRINRTLALLNADRANSVATNVLDASLLDRGTVVASRGFLNLNKLQSERLLNSSLGEKVLGRKSLNDKLHTDLSYGLGHLRGLKSLGDVSATRLNGLDNGLGLSRDLPELKLNRLRLSDLLLDQPLAS